LRVVFRARNNCGERRLIVNYIDNTLPNLGIPAVASFDATQSSDLLVVQLRYKAVELQGQTYHRERALTFRAQWLFLNSVGKMSLENHVEKVLGFDVKTVRSTGHAVSAMGVTGINVYAETDKVKRAGLHNQVQKVTQALDALSHFKADHEHLSDDEFVSWYNDNGRLVGLHSAFLQETRPKAQESVADEGAVEKAIASIITNQSAFEVAALPNLSSGVVTVYVAQGEGDVTRMVRLDVTNDFIASLAKRAPDPMLAAPDNLVFYRQLLTLGDAVVPDQVSDIPLVPLKPGEKVTATTKMFPANALILHRNSVFSIAATRKIDGLIVEATANDGVKTFMPEGNVFIDTLTRHTMLERLRESSVAAGYIKGGVGREEKNDRTTITFNHEDEKLSGKLIAKPLADMGSLFVHCVVGFEDSSFAATSGEERHAFNTGFLARLVKKRDDHPVTIAFGPDGISFQHGKAEPFVISCETSGVCSIRVTQSDFKRALSGLLDMPLIDRLEWLVDKRGLLKVVSGTEVGTFGVYIQGLRDGEAAGVQVKSREMLARIEKETEFVSLAA
jgi:hypothetical protein